MLRVPVFGHHSHSPGQHVANVAFFKIAGGIVIALFLMLGTIERVLASVFSPLISNCYRC